MVKDNFTFNQIANSTLISDYFYLKGLDLPKSPSTIASIVDRYANELKNQFANELKNKFISVQLDEQTNSRNKRFMSVIATSKEKLFNLGLI